MTIITVLSLCVFAGNRLTLKPSPFNQFRHHDIIRPKVSYGTHQLSSTVLQVCKTYLLCIRCIFKHHWSYIYFFSSSHGTKSKIDFW